MAVPDVGKVQGHKSLFDVADGGSRPQELKDDSLPDLFFGRTVKEQMASRIQLGQANIAIERIKDMGHHVVQTTTMRDAPVDEPVYHISLDIGK